MAEQEQEIVYCMECGVTFDMNAEPCCPQCGSMTVAEDKSC